VTNENRTSCPTVRRCSAHTIWGANSNWVDQLAHHVVMLDQPFREKSAAFVVPAKSYDPLRVVWQLQKTKVAKSRGGSGLSRSTANLDTQGR
jgi:hypothetical protein